MKIGAALERREMLRLKDGCCCPLEAAVVGNHKIVASRSNSGLQPERAEREAHKKEGSDTNAAAHLHAPRRSLRSRKR